MADIWQWKGDATTGAGLVAFTGSQTVVISGTATAVISGTTTVVVSGTATVNFSGSGTVAVSGTATVNFSGSGTVNISGNGTASAGDTAPTQGFLIGGRYNSADQTYTDGTFALLALNSKGEMKAQLAGSAPADAKTVGAGDVNAILAGYNGATYDRWRNNIEGALLASAARTASAVSPDQTNYNARGVLVILYVTSANGTAGLTLNINSRTGGVAYNLNVAPTAIAAIGTYAYEVCPGASTAGTAGTEKVNQRTAGGLPRTWYAAITHNDTSSYTYKVDYALIN